MRLASVEASREIFSPSCAPDWLNVSFERGQPGREHFLDLFAARRDDLGDLIGALCMASVILVVREISASVTRLPAVSNFLATSPPRKLRSR